MRRCGQAGCRLAESGWNADPDPHSEAAFGHWDRLFARPRRTTRLKAIRRVLLVECAPYADHDQ
jgi:hypothetical protein